MFGLLIDYLSLGNFYVSLKNRFGSAREKKGMPVEVFPPSSTNANGKEQV